MMYLRYLKKIHEDIYQKGSQKKMFKISNNIIKTLLM